MAAVSLSSTHHTCIACDTAKVLVKEERVPELGKAYLCVNPTACRERAQRKGIWKEYNASSYVRRNS